MPPLVCMPASQCKSRLATGYFLFMWCGASVYKGTLRLGAFFLSGCLVWCCSLVLGWPALEGELKSCAAAPPPSLQGLRSGPVWDRCLELSATQRVSSHRDQEQLYPHLLSSCSSSAALDFRFLRRRLLWKVCLCFPVWLRRCIQRRVWVQSSKASAELLIYSHQTAFSFLTSCFMRSDPCMGISCIRFDIAIDPICSLVP